MVAQRHELIAEALEHREDLPQKTLVDLIDDPDALFWHNTDLELSGGLQRQRVVVVRKPQKRSVVENLLGIGA